LKIAALISRLLLGLVFTFFGLNGFLHFLPATLPPGPAGQFLIAMFQTHYIYLIAGLQVISGILLLSGQYVLLGMLLAGPLLVNILAFHALMAPSNFAPAVVCAICWFVLFAYYYPKFAPLLQRKP
jgi:hypothetical protein